MLKVDLHRNDCSISVVIIEICIRCTWSWRRENDTLSWGRLQRTGLRYYAGICHLNRGILAERTGFAKVVWSLIWLKWILTFSFNVMNDIFIQCNETHENLKSKFTFHICPSLDSEYYFFQRRVVDFRLLKSFCSITLMLLLKRRCHWSFAFSILHQRFQIVVGWLVC